MVTDFTFEFSQINTHRTSFSLKEINWSNHGKYQNFQLIVNIPSNVSFNRLKGSYKEGRILYIADLGIKSPDNSWDFSPLSLYNSFKGQVLTKLPEGFIIMPMEFLITRLVLQFNGEERQKIASLFRFEFFSEEDRNLYFNEKGLDQRLVDLPIFIS